MKKQILFLLVLIIFFIGGCGTLGGFDTIYLSCNKAEVSKQISSFYFDNPGYIIPDKWKSLNDWKERGYDFLDGRIFYFQKNPEEMYYVTFVRDSATQANSSEIGIAIRAISKGNPEWLLNTDLSEREIKRISERFKREVLSGIGCAN